ncbi:MAG TPA: M1 family aminopeptidase [Planctomycetota bacterium]|jgi:aminopeptidase N|nr:M1 family aminopeptidase [Planctomycetota bacterium]
MTSDSEQSRHIWDPGIDRGLMEKRASLLRNCAYDLHFQLEDGAPEVSGHVEVRFELLSIPDEPLAIDFDGSAFEGAHLNDHPVQLGRVHNHLLLPESELRVGTNHLQMSFRSAVAATGTPLTVYKDNETGQHYYYTLLVPADAHRLYPCFDQPNIKATYKLALTLPTDFQTSANAPEESTEPAPDGRKIVRFRQTLPLPTYLFAFATGPYQVLTEPAHSTRERDLPPQRIYFRSTERDRVEAETLFRLHRDAVHALEDYFGIPYPFSKLDMVLCPGFPYGGMEHAGSIFYRERALAFDHEPTDAERFSRSYLMAHEVSHQWFGNLVTMNWFDDLWLKEGFATFIGYRILKDIDPEYDPWLRFHQRIKPAALRVDRTAGTTPIFQELRNLADAKSAYGPIVYNKAPAVLKELDHRLTEPRFREGVKNWLQEHAFGNATWQQLVRSLELASRENLKPWSDRYILSKGAPTVKIHIESDGEGLVRAANARQVLASNEAPWPSRISLLVITAEREKHVHAISLDTGDAPLPLLVGLPTPLLLLPNPDDVAYGTFLLDDNSIENVLAGRVSLADPLQREVLHSALFASLLEGQVHPTRMSEFLLREISSTEDTQSFLLLLSRLKRTLFGMQPRSLSEPVRNQLVEHLSHRMRNDPQAPIRLEAFRSFASLATSNADLERLVGIAKGQGQSGLPLGKEDRFLAAAALLAASHPEAESIKRHLMATESDVEADLYRLRSADPSPVSKAAVYDAYMHLDRTPEQWISTSLSYFHWPGQEDITLPFLRRALDSLPWVKTNRRIFFMPAWVEAFVGGHKSREALQIVEDFLAATPDLQADIRRKLEVPLEDLRVDVRLRQRWFGTSDR